MHPAAVSARGHATLSSLAVGPVLRARPAASPVGWQQAALAGRLLARSWRGLALSQAAAVDEVDTAAAALAGTATSDGGIFIDTISFEDGAYSVAGRLETAASPALVYEVLTDYASLDRVFHNVVHSDLLEVEGQKHLVQTCKWAFLIFSGTFKTSLLVSEDPVARRLAFHLVQSSFMRTFVGRWEVAEAAGAAKGAHAEQQGQRQQQVKHGAPAVPARSIVLHGLTVRPAVVPPAAVAHYTSKIFVQQVESILQDLQAELRRRMEAEQQH